MNKLIPISSSEASIQSGNYLMYCLYLKDEEKHAEHLTSIELLFQCHETCKQLSYFPEYSSSGELRNDENNITWISAPFDESFKSFGISESMLFNNDGQLPILFYRYFPNRVFKYLYLGPIEKQRLFNWLERIKCGEEHIFFKTEERSSNDKLEGWKGLKKLVNSSFDEMVWKSSMDTLVVNYINDCEPCDDLFPVIEFVGNLLEEGGENIQIVCIDTEKNDLIDEFCQPFIPVLRLVRADPNLKTDLVECGEEVLTEELLKFMHSNCTNSFPIEKYIEPCKEFDKFYSVKLKSSKLLNSINEILKKLEGEGSISCSEFVREVSDRISENLAERRVEEIEILMDRLIHSTQLETLKQELEKKMLGNTIQISKEEQVKNILSAKENAILYFTATWCVSNICETVEFNFNNLKTKGPCKMIYPHVGKLSKLDSGFKFYLLDNDLLLDIFREFKIKSIPHFKKVICGEMVDDLQTNDPEILSEWVFKKE